MAVGGCSGGGAVAPTTSPAAASTKTTTTPVSPSTSTTDSVLYRAGESLTGQEFAGQLLERTQGSTVEIRTTGGGRRIHCIASVGDGVGFVVFSPVKGIKEMRIVGDVAYLQDRPGASKSWVEINLVTHKAEVPTKAIADALNLIAELEPGDCRGNDRLAALDAAGDVKVKAATASGWTLTAPTDPESQGPKNSESKRSYVPATWKIDLDGRPLSYQASTSSRVFHYSKWDVYEIAAPPASQVRK
ncbi:hypothetical protein [Phycicoccus sp. Root563]|uniref:hypothetical protein n=1 Tax=Phycicoccus sp. Root563 TaxID=1736562 RepID=UPI0012F8BE68|nr:hypothetical protein [Phycicoccus sp. Root563]